MPGLIHSTEYETKKAQLVTEQHVERAFDAAEWKLQCSSDFIAYEKIAQTPTRGPVLAYTLPATELSPGLVIVFGFEKFGGEEKILLLDFKLIEVEDQDDDGLTEVPLADNPS